MTTKNKDPKQAEPEKLELLDEIKESTYFQWLVDNRQSIPYVFIATIILIAIAFKFTSGKASRAESNYLLAENYFVLLNRSLHEEAESDNVLTSLDKLKEITTAYPELQSRYDGLIAQLLIAMNNPQEAKEFADRSLERTAQDNLTVYNNFSKTTLLIAEGAYNQALTESKSLKNNLLQSSSPFSFQGDEAQSFTANLFAYNLLRIAMLEKEAGTPDGEIKAWKEWKRYADNKSDPVLAEAFATIDRQLKEGDFSVNLYIKAREAELGQSF